MKEVAGVIEAHLDGVLNTVERGCTNARLEGMKSIIQSLKKSVRFHRNSDP